MHGPGAVAQVVKGPHLARPGSHMGAGSNPGSPASLPAPCLWLGKAVEDGPKLWDPAPAWETRKSLLALDRSLLLLLSISNEDLVLIVPSLLSWDTCWRLFLRENARHSFSPFSCHIDTFHVH